MTVRVFLVPMVGPLDGKGTRENPWRPKYLREMNLDFSSQGNLRGCMLCRIEGDDKSLESLAAQPDVVEVVAGQDERSKNQVREMTAASGLTLEASADLSLEGLRASIAAHKRSETKEARDALAESMRSRRGT